MDEEPISKPNIVDIDDPNLCTELEVPEYCPSIMKYLFHLEKSTRSSSTYLNSHKEVNEDMRGILVNWLFEVHLEFKTLTETLFLAVSLLDRYLERNASLSRRRLQLIGMTAIFIACKYEQTYLPSIADLVDICAEAYTGEAILDAESEILRVIEWDISAVTPRHFLRRFAKGLFYFILFYFIIIFSFSFFSFFFLFLFLFNLFLPFSFSTASGLNNKQFCLASYFTELTLPDYSMLAFPASMIAAAAIFVTRKTCDLEPFWVSTSLPLPPSLPPPPSPLPLSPFPLPPLPPPSFSPFLTLLFPPLDPYH